MSNTKKYFFLNSRKNVINVLPNLCLLRLALIMCVHPLHIVEVFNVKDKKAEQQWVSNTLCRTLHKNKEEY